MSDSTSRLPARPSLEQLQKQAKELLRQSRARQEEGPADRQIRTLADAQFAIARQYGFESWAKLKRHLEAPRPAGIAAFEELVSDVAVAYSSDNRHAVRAVNATYGTSFGCDFHELGEMHRQLPNWYASETRAADLAQSDARRMVAHFYGFESWSAFAGSFTGSSAVT